MSVQMPQCGGEVACAPWRVAWISSTIVIATNATEETKIRSIVYASFLVRGVTNKRKPPGGATSGGVMHRRDWVHPPTQRWLLSQSRYLIMRTMWQRCVIRVVLVPA